MTLHDLHPIYREALCVWEAFRRVGFPASQIYVGRHPQDGSFIVALPHLKYGWMVTPSGVDRLAFAKTDPEELRRGWTEAANLWNELGTRKDPEVQAVWENSDVYSRTVEFVACMASHGIELPCTADC